MADPSDYAAQIISALAITEPTLDTSIGSPLRNIIDAFAGGLSSVAVDDYLTRHQYDIDSMVGSTLDSFSLLFGRVRKAAIRATGQVTFARQAPATSDILIGAGTQVTTTVTPQQVFQTLVAAVIPVGQTQVTVPCQAVVGGSAGNVGATLINQFITPVGGVSSVINTAAMSNGRDVETDDAFRQRLKLTIFRNLAGTEQMFLGIALNDPNITQANVIGAASSWREQIQLSGGTAVSTIPDAQYVYPNTEVFGAAIDAGLINVPGLEYTFDPITPPTVASISPAVPDGIYDLAFDYVSTVSRNKPLSGITNRIDIYVVGDNEQAATQTISFENTQVFSSDPANDLYIQNFRRTQQGTAPVAGNYLIPFAFSPVTIPTLTGQITIGGVIYNENVDFFLVNDITPEGGTGTSLSGIEWVSVANGGSAAPANGTLFSVTYNYNATPGDVQVGIDQWRLLGFDVQVHAAKPVLLNFYLGVILAPGVTVASIQTQVNQVVSDYLAGLGFNSVLQVSKIIELVQEIPGVNAVRLLNSGDDSTHYAIQEVSPLGAVLQTYASGTPARAVDVTTNDDSVPVMNSVNMTVFAQNRWGVP